MAERETPREDPLAFCCQAMVCRRRLSAGRANRLARNGWRLKTSSSSSCWRHRFAAWLAMSRPQAHEPRQRPRSSWHRRSRRTTNGAIVSMVPSFGISVVGHRTPLARFEDPGHASMQSKQPHSRRAARPLRAGLKPTPPATRIRRHLAVDPNRALHEDRRGPAAWYLLVQTVGSSRPLRASWDVDS